MKLIPLTQGRFAIVDDQDYDELTLHQWYYFQSGGYGARYNKGKTILMHRQLLDVAPGLHTDHKNGNGLDNRRENLRICRHWQNVKNRKLNSDNTSGAKGVRVLRGKWEARIQSDLKLYSIGLYETKAEAVVAYDVAAMFLHGEFARPNSVL